MAAPRHCSHRSTWAASGKTFITANNSPYDTLDPHAVFDIGRIGSRLNMYDCLVRWVDNPPKLQMWLADKIDISPDGADLHRRDEAGREVP